MIAIASDHAAYNLKEAIKKHLDQRKIKYTDCGTSDRTVSVDYTDFGQAAAEKAASGECKFAILVCGTGIGMSIAANKIKGIRAAVCGDVFSAKATRLHNDANVLCIGERVTGEGLAMEIVDAFLDTAFSNDERHIRRINKITAIENKYYK